MCAVVYFSSVSENTHRFVEKLGLRSFRIPLRAVDAPLCVREPHVLVVPTYGGGAIRHAVPKQVIRYLNDPDNRKYLRGVVSSGNTNFGTAFCTAGPIIAAKCGVPELGRFELLGTKADVKRIRDVIISTLKGVNHE